MPAAVPFAEQSYVLGASSLRRMTGEASGILSQRLARMDPWLRLGSGEERLLAFLSGKDDTLRVFTIEHEAALAGLIAVRHPWLSGPYLNLLAVLPEFQHRGIGRAAMAWLEGEAERAAARSVWLCVSAFNTRALAFYEQQGFRRTALLEDLLTDGEQEILMRKRLR